MHCIMCMRLFKGVLSLKEGPGFIGFPGSQLAPRMCMYAFALRCAVALFIIIQYEHACVLAHRGQGKDVGLPKDNHVCVPPVCVAPR